MDTIADFMVLHFCSILYKSCHGSLIRWVLNVINESKVCYNMVITLINKGYIRSARVLNNSPSYEITLFTQGTYGKSEIGAHVKSNICYLIWSRRLIIPKAVDTNLFFPSLKISFSSSVRNMVRGTIYKNTMCSSENVPYKISAV